VVDFVSEPSLLAGDRRGTSSAIDRIQSLPVHCLGQWPTPLESIDHSSLGRVLVKRDDLAGFGGDARSGVKARKLEGLLGHMHGNKLRRLRMPLGNLTNLGTGLIEAAAVLGIDVKLDLVNNPPLLAATRETLHRRYVGHATLSGASYVAAALRLGVHHLRDHLSGKPSLCLLPSPAHPSAILGMARGYLEMAKQSKKQFGILPGTVYIASASGTSVAGLALGEALCRALGDPPVRIVAVQVVPEPLRIWLPILFASTVRFLRPARTPRLRVEVVSWPEHTVYGRFAATHEAVCHRVESKFGLTIDPVYGAKSWDVMERTPVLRDNRLPLFWHCGYTPNWRELAPQLRL
jgi:1-aminocyclopropane-1-carboxylate deaminase/D-cysteine desulfhydrase-like pyridoxal-dependent ACC family enzyme